MATIREIIEGDMWSWATAVNIVEGHLDPEEVQKAFDIYHENERMISKDALGHPDVRLILVKVAMEKICNVK